MNYHSLHNPYMGLTLDETLAARVKDKSISLRHKLCLARKLDLINTHLIQNNWVILTCD